MAPRSGRVNPQVQTRGAARSFVENLDTYYQPSRDNRKERAFQQGLSQFGAMFQEQAARVQQDRREGYYQQGQLDALAEQAGEELKGVRDGNILRQNSRFYEIGLNEGRGSAAGIKWKNDLAVEFAQSGIDVQQNPEAFRAWMDQKTNDFLSQFEGNQYAIEGAMPHVKEAVQNLSATYSSNLNESLHQERLDIYETEIANIWDAEFRGDVDTQSVVDALKVATDELYETEDRAATDHLVNGTIRYAVGKTDAEPLLIISKNMGKDGFNLNQRQKQLVYDAIDQIEADRDRQTKALSEKEKEWRKQVGEQASNGYLKALQENPYASAREFYKQFRDEALDGEEAEWLFKELKETQDLYQDAQKNDAPSDGELYLAFKSEWAQAETRSDKMNVLAKYTGLGLSKTDVAKHAEMLDPNNAFGQAMKDESFANQRSNYVDAVKSIGESPLVSEFSGATKMSTVAQGLYDDLLRTEAKNWEGTYEELHNKVAAMTTERLLMEYGDSFPEEGQLALLDLVKEPQARKLLQERIERRMEQRQKEIEALERELDEMEAQGMFGQGGAGMTGNPADDWSSPRPQPRPPQPSQAERIEDWRQEGGRDFGQKVVEGVQNFVEGGSASSKSRRSIEEEDVVFQDPETDPEYSEEKDTFYGELLHRLTDGKDERVRNKALKEVLETDTAFAEEVYSLAADLQTDPEALMAVMSFETGGTFDTGVRNAAGSGATGLIQFMPATARGLGTTTEALAQMSRVEQMKYVRKYFEQFNFDLKSGGVDDLYMAVLYPKAVGKPKGYALFRRGTKAYDQNRGLDTNGDGVITKYEAAAKVRNLM